MKPFSGPNYRENETRCGKKTPCGYCGKAIKDNKTAVMVFICCDDWQPASAQGAHQSHGNNMGGYPLGPDCARKLKKLRPEVFE